MNATSSDPFNLSRFLEAQASDYERALQELKAGRKRTHWIWYVFPQVAGFGSSSDSRLYAIGSKSEAEAYLAHPVLGARLRECSEALLNQEGRSALEIMGNPDQIKLWSSMTLFSEVDIPGSVFDSVLERYFSGHSDPKTLEYLQAHP
jgi:uncharacterized protein (DUF1810 family)